MAPRRRQKSIDAILKSIYYNPKALGSFSGIHAIQHALTKKRIRGITARDITRWLSSQDTYTLHKPARQHYKRSAVVVGGMDHQWQADVVNVSRLAVANKGNAYLLTVIDVFSKHAWVQPMKSEKVAAVIKAFSTIVSRARRKPLQLQTDRASVFCSTRFQTWLKRKQIEFFTTYDDQTKASVVERFNRTLRDRMWKYFTYRNTRKYLTVLPQLVSTYNQSNHRSIKMAPVEVTRRNQEEVWQNLYAPHSMSRGREKKPVFKKGDTVRISKTVRSFRRGYRSNWKKDVYTIHRVLSKQSPVRYELADEKGLLVKGTFYTEELQKITGSQKVFLIEQLVDEKKVRGKKMILVKWVGYAKAYNSWIPAREVLEYTKAGA